MKKDVIKEIEQKMLNILNNEQMIILDEILNTQFFNKEIIELNSEAVNNKIDYLQLFLVSKKLEGCSERTVNYYESTINNMLIEISKSANQIETEELRDYLVNYQSKNTCSKVTIDNVRRILSSFFSWLEDENYIIKSPVRNL
jgi:site-specific recombinase XerD